MSDIRTPEPLPQKKLPSYFNSITAVGEFCTFLGRSVVSSIRKPPALSLILKQLYDVGVASLPVVAITGFFTGLVLAAQSFYQLQDKGLEGVTGIMVAKAMITELGPVLTAFMLTGRVGAAMCAELGTMKVSEQIDALQTMSVNPLQYLVGPRLLSGIIMTPLLTTFSVVMGIFGGYLIAVHLFGMASSSFFDPMPIHISKFDLVTGLVKSFLFGVLIMTVSCYKGMKTDGGAEGVGLSTTQSVVIVYCLILFGNFLTTMGLNIFRWQLGI